MGSLTIDPLNPVIGAQVSGADLCAPLSPDLAKQIHAAWLEHQVLFFRGQPLDFEQHKAFGRLWGDFHIHPAAPGPQGHPEIMTVHADASSKTVAGQGWHSDVTCDEEPPKASVLHLTEVPPDGGGDTLFASMYAAWDALSDSWQRMLDGLTAVHASEHVYRGRYGADPKLRDGGYPRAEHPVVRTHPETGRKALFVNSGFTTHIRGMRHAESRATLGFLFEHVRSPEFQCRFRWQADSVAFWDNRCVQHLALWDYHPNVRHGYRVTIAGDRPR
ncbi:MAG: TauD/TfdA family dioxygenase [Deltaproteobacteria bacterium]|nr:TauD/TfdA family dioxygenase [Deltaproteobacteria bacterium]